MQKEREMKEKQELNMGTTCLEIGIKREDEGDKNNPIFSNLQVKKFS